MSQEYHISEVSCVTVRRLKRALKSVGPVTKLGFFRLPEKPSRAEGKCEVEVVGGISEVGVPGTPFIQSISAFIYLFINVQTRVQST